MPKATVRRHLLAEFLGTLFLVCTVVGSGIMADTLTDDTALALLGNTLATGAILVVLIAILGPVSGAHFNPVVSLVMALRGKLSIVLLGGFVLAQMLGGICGSWLAHLMFDQPVFQLGSTPRTGLPQWIAEVTATFGLVITILMGSAIRKDAVPWLVGLYITAAYWFTASTSFANPAVTFARGFSDTFAGIRPIDMPIFWLAQLIGAILALCLYVWITDDE